MSPDAEIFGKPLAFSYVRMSTATQLKGDSLTRQIDASRRYAEENGLHLVESLQDIGISAYRGSNAKSGKLREFLDLVDAGEVPAGSTLIIESLDRLSRENVLPSFQLFLRILSAGVNIVTLMDGQKYDVETQDFQQLIITLAVMSRANEESEIKSKRISSAWKSKRKNISNTKLTKLCPAWMKLSEDRSTYEIIPERAEIVRQIFQLAADGDGSYAIARKLNKAGVHPFGRSKLWIKSYITKILTERVVLGEFQPHRLVDGRRVPEGEAISSYFPAIVDEAIFYSVQASRKLRGSSGRGRRGTGVPNLFKNIAVCDYCSQPMHYVNRGNGPKGGTYLQCSGSMSGSGCSPIGWRYRDFETSFLFFCTEIDLRSILVETDKRGEVAKVQSKIGEAQGRLSSLEHQRDQIFALLEKLDDTNFVAAKLNAIQVSIDEQTSVVEELKAILVAKRSPVVIDESELIDLVKTLQARDEKTDGKMRETFRKKLISMTEYLRVSPAGRKPFKKAAQKIMLENALDEEDRRRMEAEFSKIDPMMPDSHYFRVGFVGDIHKIVVVDARSATKFETMVELRNGQASLLESARLPKSLN